MKQVIYILIRLPDSCKGFLFVLGLLLVNPLSPLYGQQRVQRIVLPFESQFFFNPYLANPAMAGLDSGLQIHLSYRKQFQGFPGAPLSKAVTAGYHTAKRVGLGLMAYNDQAGLFSHSRLLMTYAYHLPVGADGQQLHFGLSAVYVHHHMDTKDIRGNPNDPLVAAFNGAKNAFDIDYGIAYTNARLRVQGSLKNVIGYLRKTGAARYDASVFYLAAAYRFSLSGLLQEVEPQLSLRGTPQRRRVWDAGLRLRMADRILSLYGIYHSTKNFSVGVGLHYKQVATICFGYLSQPGAFSQYTDGNFEIDLGLFLLKQ